MILTLLVAFSLLPSEIAQMTSTLPHEPQEHTTLSYKLAFTARTLVSDDQMVLDPNGRYVAYSVHTPTPHGQEDLEASQLRYTPTGTPKGVVGTRVALTEIKTGKTRSLGPDGANSWRPSWSPDGKQLAFFCDANGAPRLWLCQVETGAERKVSDAMVKPSLWVGDQAAWSRDGKEVYVPLRPAVSHSVKSVTASKIAPADAPTVREYFSGKEERPETAAGPASSDLTAYLRAEQTVALGAIRIDTGEVRVIVDSTVASPPGIQRLSPSGKWLSYLSVIHVPAPGSVEYTYDLVVVPVAGGPIHVLAKDVEMPERDYYGGTYRWHPQQDILVFQKHKQLWVADFSTGTMPHPEPLAFDLGEIAPQPLAFTPDGRLLLVGIKPVDHQDHSDPKPTTFALLPFGAGSPSVFIPMQGDTFRQVLTDDNQTLWQPDSHAFYSCWQDTQTKETLILRTDIPTGTSVIAHKVLAHCMFYGGNARQSLVTAFYEDVQTPPDLYGFGTDFAHKRRLSHVEPELDAVAAAVRPGILLTTRAPRYDGTLISVKSVLFLPQGAKQGDKLPTLVCLYGGRNMSLFIDRFGGGGITGIPIPLFVSRGYAVLFVDTPISPTGTGSNPLQETTDLLLPQVYHAAEAGYCDLDRMAVIGHSYGGYCAAGVITQTNIFRAAIAISGLYDLASTYAWINPFGVAFPFSTFELGQFRMGTHPWADLKRYLANSPFYQADKIQTPLLMIQGEADRGCPVEEARKMFQAGKRLGKTMQLATYPGEDHVVDEWSLANAIDASRRILSFLDKYVRRQARKE